MFEFSKNDFKKFNKIIKVMIRDMLNKRKDLMINLSMDLVNREDVIDEDRFKQ